MLIYNIDFIRNISFSEMILIKTRGTGITNNIKLIYFRLDVIIGNFLKRK